MRYQADHDLHIHSLISPCAGHDPRQTKEAIFAYGMTNGFKLLCLTDHIWDRKGPGDCQLWRGKGLDIEKEKEMLPLPQSPMCRFLFGMEVDMDNEFNIAVTEEEYDTFDFMIFAPSHMHMFPPNENDYAGLSVAEAHKRHYMARIDSILNRKLPFEKCGLAHFTTVLCCKKDPFGMLRLFTDDEYEDIFSRVSKLGMGVELNFDHEFGLANADEREQILRPYKIAKNIGCKFYLGSDIHRPETFHTRLHAFEQAIDLLDLTEDDKLPFVLEHRATADSCP